jgi:hypothetical protein
LVREEDANLCADTAEWDGRESAEDLSVQQPSSQLDPEDYEDGMKALIRQAISELIDEIEQSSSEIASKAQDHIHAK